MKPSNELHALIRAMTKAERRRFSIDCAEEARYVQLFHAIAAQPQYDEAGIKAQFAGEAFIRNFSVAKAYLYERVLHSLRTPHTPLSPEMAQRRFLDDIEILHGKGLYTQASDVVARALRLARLYDLPAQEAELCKWHRRLIHLQPSKDRTIALSQVDQDESSALRRLADEATLRALRAQVQSIALDQIDLRLPEKTARLQQLMEQPLLASEPSALGFNARIAYHQIHATQARLLGRTEAQLDHHRAILKAWHDAPAIRQAHPHLYLNALAAFLDACIRAHIFQDFWDTLAILHALPSADAHLRAQAFYLGHHLELRYAISTGDLQAGIHRAEAIEQGLQLHAKFLNAGIPLAFHYNLAVVHFLAFDFQSTIRYINRILNQPNPAVRQDIFDATRVMELATHFALGNHDLLESLLRSMARRLRLHPRTHAFEKVVVQGLRRLLDTPAGQHREAFEGIATALETMEGSSYLTGREEILLWVRANIEGKLPADLMRGA